MALTDHDTSRILVVDDDWGLRNGLTAILGERYEVLEASNGKEALDRLARNGVALVVLDLAMPVRDGESVLRAMRAWGLTIPVIVMSASVERLPGARALGADATLRKPFDVGVLEEKIDGLLAAGRPSPPA